MLTYTYKQKTGATHAVNFTYPEPNPVNSSIL